VLTYTASEARAKLPEIIDLVVEGHEVSITRHGKPVVVVINPSALRTRRAAKLFADAEALGRSLDDARHRPLAEGSMTEEYAEELIAEIRAGRDAR
jgi:prevent-host-death family protein